MDWKNLITIALGAILINNFIFSQFLGICPFMGVSKSTDTASGMGLAVTFVMGLASAVCWPINHFVLEPAGLVFMQTIVYILVIASLVQFIEVLGVVLQNTQNTYGFVESVVYGVTGGLGFLLAIYLFAAVREKLEYSECPKAFEGFPIALVTAGLLALSFGGFSGLKLFG